MEIAAADVRELPSKGTAVSFDLSEELLDPHNLIVEGVFDVGLVPMGDSVFVAGICMPFSRGTGVDAALHIYWEMAEFGVFDRKSTTMQFELSRALYAATENKIRIDGFIVVPIEGSTPFVIEKNKAKIDLSYYPCGRYVED